MFEVQPSSPIKIVRQIGHWVHGLYPSNKQINKDYYFIYDNLIHFYKGGSRN